MPQFAGQLKIKEWYKSGKELLDEISSSRAAPRGAAVWFFGQSGFVINLGAIIYVDVMLHEWEDSSSSVQRLFDPPFSPPVDADVFACTHGHSDHFNLKTILPQAQGNPKTRFLVPAALSAELVAAGIPEKRILPAYEGGKINLDNGVTVECVPAEHCDDTQDSTLGYIFRKEDLSIYHAGDTFVTEKLLKALHGAMPINIAMLPVNGSDWDRTRRGIIGNMNCYDAAKLACVLNIDLTIPAHFDFISGNTVSPSHIADVFYNMCPEKKMHILALGEKFLYSV